MVSKFTLMLQFFFIIFLFTSATTGTNQCTIDMSKSQFDIVVLQDNTKIPESDIEDLSRKFTLFSEEVQSASPGSRFGYGVYNTYPETRPQDVGIKSFEVLSSLDTFTIPFIDALESSFTQQPPRSRSQSSLLAVALSAQDKDNEFDWRTESSMEDGKKLYKVIILNTQTVSLMKGDDHWFSLFRVVRDPKTKEYKKVDSREFSESGNEDATFESPSLQQIRNILKKHKIALLVLNKNKQTFDFWESALRGFGLLLNIEGFSRNDFRINVLEGLKQAVCLTEAAAPEKKQSSIDDEADFEFDSFNRREEGV